MSCMGISSTFTKLQDEKEWVIHGCTTSSIGCVDCKNCLSNMKKMQPIWNNLAKYLKMMLKILP